MAAQRVHDPNGGENGDDRQTRAAYPRLAKSPRELSRAVTILSEMDGHGGNRGAGSPVASYPRFVPAESARYP